MISTRNRVVLAILTPIVAYDMLEPMLQAFEAMREADKKIVDQGGPGAPFASFRLYATAPQRDLIAAQIKRQAHKDKLAAFFKSYLDHNFQQHPVEATEMGDHRFDRQLDDGGKDLPGPSRRHRLIYHTLFLVVHETGAASEEI